MGRKKLVAIVGMVDVVLLVICLVLYLGKDRKEPEIFFDEENQIVYAEGMDKNLLLEGVTAVDEKDGDVSASLLVEKVAGTNGKEVIVTYVARDSSNNVGKASRALAVMSNFGGRNDFNEEEGDVETTELAETENTTATETETVIDSKSTAEEEGQGEENVKEEEPAGPNPVLTLNADVIETNKGMAPNWHEVIEIMSDDKDDYNTLYNNLKLEGQVKLNDTGEYPVLLYTVDTDGNRSEVSNLVVKVN